MIDTSRLTAALAGRYAIERELAARALALEPGLIKAREQQALGDLRSGRAERCATEGLGPQDAVRAMCLHSLGKVREAARIADSVRAAFTSGLAGDSTSSPVIATRGLAQYYAWTGNAGESLAWLERTFAISPEGEDFNGIASGMYDKVRNVPRFAAGLQSQRARIHDRVQPARIGARQP